MRTVRLPSGEQVAAIGQGTWYMGDRKSEATREVAARTDSTSGSIKATRRVSPLRDAFSSSGLPLTTLVPWSMIMTSSASRSASSR